MANLKINTESAVTAAGNIQTINGQIWDDFSNVQSAMTRLDNVWEGPAATYAIGKFNESRTQAKERYDVVDNFVNFLLQPVGEGYVQTEEANKSLADAFK